MGGYGGYGKQSDFMKQIIQELDELIVEINDVEENIYIEKLYIEWGTTSKQKVSNFINKNLDSNETLLFQLEKINCKVMAESELKEAIEKLVKFCNRIKELLIKSKDLEDFPKWLELSNYKDELFNQIKSLSEKSEKDANIIENLKTKLTSDLNTFESRYKDQFTRAELMKQQDIFSIQASDYKTKSNFWSKLIIATSLFLVFALWIVFNNFCFEFSCFDKICDVNYDSLAKNANEKILYLEIFKSVAYRLFIISFILYLINFCVKNFNASMHNYTVNSHKANSLSAAIILIDKARTDEGNDNIMTQAANSIFSHQSTGYINKNPENLQASFTEKIIDKINPIPKG